MSEESQNRAEALRKKRVKKVLRVIEMMPLNEWQELAEFAITTYPCSDEFRELEPVEQENRMFILLRLVEALHE